MQACYKNINKQLSAPLPLVPQLREPITHPHCPNITSRPQFFSQTWHDASSVSYYLTVPSSVSSPFFRTRSITEVARGISSILVRGLAVLCRSLEVHGAQINCFDVADAAQNHSHSLLFAASCTCGTHHLVTCASQIIHYQPV